MKQNIYHAKIGRNSSIINKTGKISSATTKIGENLYKNSAITDPWIFDIQWTAYPQLEGKLKLYLTCNPEFPIHVDYYGVKAGYVLIQVAPSSDGEEVWDENANDGDGAYIWQWNDGTSFDINTSISSTKRSDGKPNVWEFSANSDEEYCVFCLWSESSSSTSYAYNYGFFTMPTLFSKPSTPTLSGNTIKVTVNDDEAYTTALEFCNTSSPPSPWNSYDDATRALFFETACQETESYLENKYSNSKKFKIWSKTSHTIGVNFMSSVSSSMRSTFKGYVQQAVNKINSTVSSSGFSLTIVDGITDGTYEDIEQRNGVGEIQLWWGSYEELWNESAPKDWRYFGQWYNNESSSNTYLTEGWVKLCTEKVWTMNFQGITWEEIVECLGIGNDMFYDAYSTFSDYWFPAKNLNQYGGTLTPYETDLNVLRMAYNHNLPSNLNPWDCANRIYAPNGYFYNSHGWDDSGLELSFDISGLNVGDTYIFRAISLDYNNSSKFTSEASYTIEITRPDKWYWSSGIATGQSLTVNSYGIHPLTATEWNNFTSRINEFREYAGYSAYSFTTVSKNQEFTPAIYNEAVAAIKGVSGYGSYVNYISSSTVAISNCVFQIYLLESLSSEANAIAGYT